MKRNGLIILSLTAVLGVAIFWSQQRPTESAALDLDKVAVSGVTTEKQTQTPSFTKKVDDEASSHIDKDSDVVTPMTREEVIKTAQLKALKDSGLDKKMRERKRFVETQLGLIRIDRESRMGHNETAKKLLNIDVKESFNVDFDARMKKIQTQQQNKDSAELEKRLVAWGVEPEQRAEIMATRNLVLEIGN